MRHGGDADLTPVAPDATAIFFGASYHADYATILVAPADLPARRRRARRVPRRRPQPATWDVVDLRRLRCGDPAAEALAAAFGAREIAEGWTLNVEREDVCPVVTLPDGRRHRRVPRDARQEGAPRDPAQGPPRGGRRRGPARGLGRPARRPRRLHRPAPEALGRDRPVPADHRWRPEPDVLPTDVRAVGLDGPIRLTFLTVGGRRIAAGIHFETADGYLYYNAGVDPDARDLSPGVVMVHAYVERALAAGQAPAGLPARRRALQVRVGRGRRADPAPPRPTKDQLR